ncbi:hypothetical protein P4555_22725 [Peribacillus frigoritolerans]|nr:hypothetical protein [Peribacillus frigoritolerans]
MWVITVHSKNNIKIYEFDSEKEAKDAFRRMQGCKILTEVIYFNDFDLVKSKKFRIFS